MKTQKMEKITAFNGETSLVLHYELGHLYIHDPYVDKALELYPNEVEQLYNALGRFLGKESSNPPGDSL